MLNTRDFTYTNIPSQFPIHYREEGSPLVQFVQQYYKWLEERNDRNFAKIGDIDATYQRFLFSFREKYLKDFPINDNVDTRFVIKHINDLYRTKGSEEGLRILFRLFFNEEIEVFYPSTAILKPSDSIWTTDQYLEMIPVASYEDYPIQRGDTLKGNVSGATAIVDQVIFVLFSAVYTPIVFVSALDKEFTSADSIEVDSFDGTAKFPGRIISGSIISAEVLPNARVSGQQVGKRIKFISNEEGVGATGVVTEVSSTLTGSVNFEVVDPGYGYILSKSAVGVEDPNLNDKLINEVFKSDQVIVFNQTQVLPEGVGFEYTISASNVLIEPESTEFINPSSPVIPFKPDDISENSIVFLEEHKFPALNGVAVRYEKENINTSDITGLINNGTYYLIIEDSFTFKLASSLENAQAGISIPFSTSAAADNNYFLIPYVPFNTDESGNYITSLTGEGTIVEIEESLIYIKAVPEIGEPTSFDVIPDNGKVTLNILNQEGTQVGSFETTRIARANNSATFDFDVENNEKIYAILDTIEPYVGVIIESGDYGMSGVGAENLGTRIIDAFTIYELEIGRISDPLFVTNTGSNYENDVEVYIKQEEIIQFDKRDMIVRFNTSGVLIEAGDLMTQTIQIDDYEEGIQGNAVKIDYVTQARFLKRDGNDFYFRQEKFFDFNTGTAIIGTAIGEIEVEILSIRRDPNSLPMGLNVDIDGPASFETGQINAVRIDSSGYKYKNNEIVDIYGENDDTQRLATARLDATGVGKGQGQWKTKTSFLNESTRAIHDNFYYQEYSFDISSSVSPFRYETLVNETVQVAGTKLFSTPLINSEVLTPSSLDAEVEVYGLVDNTVIKEDLPITTITTEPGAILLATIIELEFEYVI